MRQRKNIYFSGTRIKSVEPVYSKFTHHQRYEMDIIVERLNNQLVKNNKLHLVKKPYTREDIIHLVEQVYINQRCDTYDKAIDILIKKLKEDNFDIYKS